MWARMYMWKAKTRKRQRINLQALKYKEFVQKDPYKGIIQQMKALAQEEQDLIKEDFNLSKEKELSSKTILFLCLQISQSKH